MAQCVLCCLCFRRELTENSWADVWYSRKMNRHQVLTGAANSGDRCFAVGNINGVHFTVCIIWSDGYETPHRHTVRTGPQIAVSWQNASLRPCVRPICNMCLGRASVRHTLPTSFTSTAAPMPRANYFWLPGTLAYIVEHCATA